MSMSETAGSALSTPSFLQPMGLPPRSSSLASQPTSHQRSVPSTPPLGPVSICFSLFSLSSLLSLFSLFSLSLSLSSLSSLFLLFSLSSLLSFFSLSSLSLSLSLTLSLSFHIFYVIVFLSLIRMLSVCFSGMPCTLGSRNRW